MIFFTLAVYALASLGLSFVVGFSKISLPFRVLLAGQPTLTSTVPYPNVAMPAVRPLIPWLGPWFVALLECPGCAGFWTGVFAFVFRDALGLSVLFTGPVHFFPGAIVFGLMTTALNMLGARALGLTE